MKYDKYHLKVEEPWLYCNDCKKALTGRGEVFLHDLHSTIRLDKLKDTEKCMNCKKPLATQPVWSGHFCSVECEDEFKEKYD